MAENKNKSVWTKEKRIAYMKEYNKKYYSENSDKEKLRVKSNRSRFKEKIKRKNKIWANKNPDKIREYNRIQYLKNRRERIEYQKKYCKEHREDQNKLYIKSIDNLGDWYINGHIRKLKNSGDKELIKKRVIKARDKKIKKVLERISGKPQTNKPYEFQKQINYDTQQR